MPTLLSTVRGSAQQVLYPFTRTVSFQTKVMQSANGSEQRFPQRPPLARLEFPYSDILTGDVAAQLAVFDAAKGKFENTLEVTIAGVVYDNLSLDDDTFESTQTEPKLYGTKFRLSQVQNLAWTPPTAPTAFPALTNGLFAQRPYTSRSRYLTWQNQLASGPQYSLSSYGGIFTGFPTGALVAFDIEYPLINQADLTIIENFFNACQGRYNPFTFTDTLTSVTYPNCRLDMDDLAIKYNCAITAVTPFDHQMSTSLKIVQVNT